MEQRREGRDGVARTEMRGCDEKVGGKGRGEGGVDLSIVTKRTRNDAGREMVPIHRLLQNTQTHQRHISVPATGGTRRLVWL